MDYAVTPHDQKPAAVSKAQKLAVLLLVLATAISSFLVTTELPIVGEKLVIADIFFAALIGLTLLHLISAGWPSPGMASEQKVVIGLLIAMFILCTLTYAYVAIPRNAGASEGAIALANYAYGILIALSVMYWVRSFADLERIVLAWIAGSAIVVVIGALALAQMAPEWAYQGNRVSSTMRSVNQMQSYLAPGFAFASTYLVSTRARPIIRLGMAALILGIVLCLLLTGSRSSTVLLAASCFVLVLRTIVSGAVGPALKLVVIVVSGAGLVAGASFVTYVQTYGAGSLPDGPMRGMARPVEKFAEMAEENTAMERLGPRGEQLVIVGQNWYKSPVFGFGPGAFKDRFNHRYEVHNTYLGVFVEQGALGLLLLMSSLAFLAWHVMKAGLLSQSSEQRRFIFGMLFALMLLYLYGMFSFGLRQRTFWLMLGMCGAAIPLVRARYDAARRPTPPAKGSGQEVPA